MQKHSTDNNISTTNKNCKKKNIPLIKTLKNPIVTHINENSNFIYDETSAFSYYEKITNKNTIKPTLDEISLLQKISNDIYSKKFFLNSEESLIQIKSDYAVKLFNYYPRNENKTNEVEDFIINIIQSNLNRESISCRKLSTLFEKTFHKKIGKSTIHNILRKRLNYRYLKTTIKTRRIETQKNKIYCFFFIKAFIKFLKIGFNLIFLDESKMELKNNHFRLWRKKDEQIVFGINNNYKKNLILAIEKDDIFYYDMFDENINSNNFIKILEKIKEKISQKNNKKYVLIMDNCSSHKTDDVIRYLNENKINALFTPPYQSTFTPIELAFRAIKKKFMQNYILIWKN